jgi:hypothetical protein
VLVTTVNNITILRHTEAFVKICVYKVLALCVVQGLRGTQRERQEKHSGQLVVPGTDRTTSEGLPTYRNSHRTLTHFYSCLYLYFADLAVERTWKAWLGGEPVLVVAVHAAPY